MWRFAVEGYTQTVKQLLFTEQELLSLRSKLVTGLRLRGTHWLTDVITVVAKLRFTVPLEVLCGWQEFIMPLLLCSLIWSPCTAYCKQGTDAKGRDYEIMWVFCFFFTRDRLTFSLMERGYVKVKIMLICYGNLSICWFYYQITGSRKYWSSVPVSASRIQCSHTLLWKYKLSGFP